MFRRIVSLTSLLSFAVTLLTSVVLYFEPHGRVAYWADWRFLGLGKTSWDGLHLTVGTLFLVTACLHVWLNWSPILLYMKNKARQMVVLTPPLVIALAITVFVSAGTLFGWPPMQQVLDLSAYLKDLQTQTHGNPPYAHAELSTLEEFAGHMGLGYEESLAALEAEGVAVGPAGRTLAEIAAFNSMTPAELYGLLRDRLSSATGDPFGLMPPAPPEGTGRMTLVDMAAQFGLPLDQVLGRLDAAGLAAQPGQTIKQVAQAAGMEPSAVYTVIRTGRRP